MAKWRYGLMYLLLVGLIACLLIGPFVFPDDRPGVTKANFDRIQEGMAYEEVDALFSREPDVFEGRLRAFSASWRNSDLSTAQITFVNGKVAEKEWRGSSLVALEEILLWMRGH